MKLLILGTMVPEKTKEYCFSMGQRTAAADTVMSYILNGLEQNEAVETVDVLGSVRIKPWPKSKIFFLSDSEEKKQKGIIKGIGYYNLPILGFILREKKIIQESKRWAKVHKEEKDILILVYSMHSPFMKAAKEIKRIIPNAKVALIVPDLPLFMDMRGVVRRILKKADWNRIKRLMPTIDKYLLFTKYMAEYLELPNEKWMVFEGLIDEKKIVTKPQEKYSDRIVLYAGNLDSRYGIDTLIEAFKILKSNVKLCIYGDGFDKKRIQKLASTLSNVEYKGQVTQKEIFEIMKKATLLVNPRPAGIGLAKFSCPSKTFEYMASGTPVIMNRLPGLPEEYEPYVYFFENEDAKSMAEGIDSLASLSNEELKKKAQNAADFLRKNKSSYVVMDKVIRFINN